MLLAVGKVMVEMISVIIENIVVFVFDFPTGAACGDSLHNIVFVNGVRCGPRIAVDKILLALVMVTSHQFTSRASSLSRSCTWLI